MMFGFAKNEQESGALFSDCGQYRYLLWRNWSGGDRLRSRRVNFLMLNPSTADAIEPDPTITRCMGFAKDWGYAGIEVTNLYAFKATKPRDLWKAKDPVGSENDSIVGAYAETTDLVVCAWGANGVKTDRANRVVERLHRLGIRLFHLGLTKDGHPRHPLFVPASQSLAEGLGNLIKLG